MIETVPGQFWVGWTKPDASRIPPAHARSADQKRLAALNEALHAARVGRRGREREIQTVRGVVCASAREAAAKRAGGRLDGRGAVLCLWHALFSDGRLVCGQTRQ